MKNNCKGDQGMASKKLYNHLAMKDVEELKTKLQTEQERILNSQVGKKSEGSANYTETKDEVDSANEDILLSSHLRFSNRENFYLKKIRKAIAKIDSGDYGLCEECGSEISFARLQARPTSEMCIGCKEESEKAESQNVHLKASKSMGKKIDLVTNI